MRHRHLKNILYGIKNCNTSLLPNWIYLDLLFINHCNAIMTLSGISKNRTPTIPIYLRVCIILTQPRLQSGCLSTCLPIV